MKRGLILVLVLVYALAGTCFAETDVPTTVKAVQEAYYEAIYAEGDGDVKYQELHMLAENLKTALSKNDQSAVEDDRVLLYGDFDDFSDEELLQKTDQFLEYVVDADDDKLSALMRKFQTMSSVSGTIEPKTVSLRRLGVEQCAWLRCLLLHCQTIALYFVVEFQTLLPYNAPHSSQKIQPEKQCGV